MARSSYKIQEDNRAYFLTCTVVNWLPLFSDPAIVEILFGSLRFLQENDRLTIYAYVVMENHLHMVVSSENLSKEMGDFKSFTATEIIKYLEAKGNQFYLAQLKANKLSHKTDRTYQLWQEGSHPQMIDGDAMMRQKVEYIHANPVRRGYVDEAADWRYSSARNYERGEGLLEVCKEW